MIVDGDRSPDRWLPQTCRSPVAGLTVPTRLAGVVADRAQNRPTVVERRFGFAYIASLVQWAIRVIAILWVNPYLRTVCDLCRVQPVMSVGNKLAREGIRGGIRHEEVEENMSYDVGAPTDSSENPVEPDPERSILMVCSSGGHLAQLMVLRPSWESKEVRWVTFDTADAISLLADERVVYAHHPTTRNVKNMFRNFGQAISLLRESPPDVIVSSGAGVAFPYFLAGWMLGIPRVYIEVVDRIETPTLTGRLCRPFATRFLVQWPAQQPMYRGSENVGVLL